MTTETYSPTGILTSRTTLSWDAATPAIVDMDKGRVELNPQQRNARKKRNRQAKAGRRASRK
jgi:hypothetical protein